MITICIGWHIIPGLSHRDANYFIQIITLIQLLSDGIYRGLELTDQAMKLLEQVLNFLIQMMGNIGEVQFGVVPLTQFL